MVYANDPVLSMNNLFTLPRVIVNPTGAETTHIFFLAISVSFSDVFLMPPFPLRLRLAFQNQCAQSATERRAEPQSVTPKASLFCLFIVLGVQLLLN